MSVRFVNSINYDIDPKLTTTTLFGKPFPPDDVKAYWSLVPEDIEVEWAKGLGIFFVSKSWLPEDPFESQPAIRKQVMAGDACKLAVWMQVISELCCGKP